MKYTTIPGMKNNKLSLICGCECHKEGVEILHCMPCCDKTYQTYTPELWEMIPELQVILSKSHQVIIEQQKAAKND